MHPRRRDDGATVSLTANSPMPFPDNSYHRNDAFLKSGNCGNVIFSEGSSFPQKQRAAKRQRTMIYIAVWRKVQSITSNT
jgi:hypothetical protein